MEEAVRDIESFADQNMAVNEVRTAVWGAIFVSLGHEDVGFLSTFLLICRPL
jgi:hypothetical protein